MLFMDDETLKRVLLSVIVACIVIILWRIDDMETALERLTGRRRSMGLLDRLKRKKKLNRVR